jgi:hypothetical protein
MIKSRIKFIVIVSCVVIFAVAIFKKGITINNNNSNYAYQNQSQGTIVINGNIITADGFEWYEIKTDSDNLINTLNTIGVNSIIGGWYKPNIFSNEVRVQFLKKKEKTKNKN